MENQLTDRIDGAYDGWSAPHPVSKAAVGADYVPFGQALRLCGWSARETAGAVAAFRVWNTGTAGQGEIVGGANLAAAGGETVWIGDKGVLCEGGIVVDWISGAFDLVLYIRHWIG